MGGGGGSCGGNSNVKNTRRFRVWEVRVVNIVVVYRKIHKNGTSVSMSGKILSAHKSNQVIAPKQVRRLH